MSYLTLKRAALGHLRRSHGSVITVQFMLAHGSGYVMGFTRIPGKDRIMDNKPQARCVYLDDQGRPRSDIICESESSKPKRAMAKAKKPKVEKYDGEWSRFSVEKAAEGGMSYAHAKDILIAAGVTHVRRAHSPYVGQYGLEVPIKFSDVASDTLFGK